MKKRTLGIILQIPVWILLVAIFISFIYLSFAGYGEVPGSSFLKYALLIWIIIILYFIGRFLQTKKNDYPSF
jgi:hypothetical protein